MTNLSKFLMHIQLQKYLGNVVISIMCPNLKKSELDGPVFKLL